MKCSALGVFALGAAFGTAAAVAVAAADPGHAPADVRQGGTHEPQSRAGRGKLDEVTSPGRGPLPLPHSLFQRRLPCCKNSGPWPLPFC